MKRLLLLILLVPRLAYGAITFDATAGSGGEFISSLSYSLTVDSDCANPIIVVDVTWVSNSAETITSQTIGGVGATLIDNVYLVDVGNRWLASYQRTSVSFGSNAIAITFSAAISVVGSSARSYCGVDQTSPIAGTPVQAAGESAGPATVNVSSATGELVIATAVVRNETITGYGGAQTPQYNDTGFAGTDAPGSGSVTMDHTLSASSQWGIIGFALVPAATAPPSGSRRRVVVVQ